MTPHKNNRIIELLNSWKPLKEDLPDVDKGLLLDAYQKGDLSLGQLSKELKVSKQEMLKMLPLMGLDSIDYDFDDENIPPVGKESL